MIKNLFNSLKLIGRKKYYFKNGEEELYFFGENIVICIFYTNDKLDLVFEYAQKRENFLFTPILSELEKNNVKSILNSMLPLKERCNYISNILLNNAVIQSLK